MGLLHRFLLTKTASGVEVLLICLAVFSSFVVLIKLLLRSRIQIENNNFTLKQNIQEMAYRYKKKKQCQFGLCLVMWTVRNYKSQMHPTYILEELNCQLNIGCVTNFNVLNKILHHSTKAECRDQASRELLAELQIRLQEYKQV